MSTSFFITAFASLLQASTPAQAVEPSQTPVSTPDADTQMSEPATVEALPEPEQVETREDQTAQRDALARRAQTYLEGLTTLEARFTQVGPSGESLTGELFISRPGRIRFAYDEPSPILIVADGSTVAIQDKELETVDRAPIGTTPLKWLLEDQTQLVERGAVSEAEYYDGLLYVTVEDPDGEVEGRITFAFEDPDPDGPASAMTLIQWYALDAVGGLTQMQLENIQRDHQLNPRLFILDDDASSDDRRRGRRR